MNVLINCEESQMVCIEFRKRGHNAFSCDLQEPSGGHPEWHIQDDAIKVAYNKRYRWDMMIGFPPCTDLANAGGCHFKRKRMDGSQKKSILFFYKMASAPIKMIALENPVGILCSNYIHEHFPELIPKLSAVNLPRRPDQVIQPFYFGDPVRKYTCLWLKNLPPLQYHYHETLFDKPTVVKPEEPTKFIIRQGGYRPGTIRKLYWQDLLPKKDRAKIKSKTFPGIAAAMADQWG